MRWLNPVGVADHDGDGVSEVAAMVTPHIGGLLTVYQKRGKDLVALATLPGSSNHRYGSSELAMSAALNWGGAMRLLVPDTERRVLRVIALRDGAFAEQGRCALRAPTTGAMRVRGDHALVQTGAGVQSVASERLYSALWRKISPFRKLHSSQEIHGFRVFESRASPERH